MTFKKFVHLTSSGDEAGAVTVEHLWANVYGLRRVKTNHELSKEQWHNLLQQAVIYGKSIDNCLLAYRLIEESDATTIRECLKELVFHKKSERVEYRTSVDILPNNNGNPIQWRSATQLGWSKFQIAECLRQVAIGAPDYDPNEDALIAISDWLDDPILTHGPDCIYAGFLDDQLCALVVAQVNPKSKWSRLSYMGLTPPFREKDLGQWVHRQGFQLIREQGGEIYHGGTLKENAPMIRLFERHNCQAFAEMQEWHISLGETHEEK